MLGDIAIAYETMRREADDEQKPFDHHLSHLAIHGFLHLIGYDHETDDDAEAMESLEQRDSGATRHSRSLCGPGPDGLRCADSEPTHDNPRNTRNLPAVVPAGEVLRPAAESWLTRAIRTLFGWKPGSVRDDLQVVLDA